mmetsp:Transcript_3783/g.7275  ORF Transcript_3783/g.7275 Transcript_3783/m.7275 type:complete len:81 (+) Transcript_3783:487-729(+)
MHMHVQDASIFRAELNTVGIVFSVKIEAVEDAARVVIFGGLPFPEPRHMFWNFVATTKDTISSAAAAWSAMDRNGVSGGR